MPTFGVWELVVILIIVVVIFGAGRLSEVGGALGKGIREFRKATTDDHPAAPPAPAAAPVVPAVAPASSSTPQAATATPTAGGTVVAAVVVENKCLSCATINPPSQVFCGQCGTRLTRA